MPGTAEDPGRVQCCWQLSAQANYVHYHAQQFVSAVLVLLRYMTRVVNAVGMQGDGVSDDLVKQLHYDIQMVRASVPPHGSGESSCGGHALHEQPSVGSQHAARC